MGTTYTEADVERWFKETVGGIDSTEPTDCALAGMAVTKLKAAALEGAKVPGLEAEVARLQKQTRSIAEKFNRDVPELVDQRHELRSEVSALQAQVATLTEQHASAIANMRNEYEDQLAQCRAACESEAVQRREAWREQEATDATLKHEREKVATLTAERDLLRDAHADEQDMRLADESERDALRAQVAPMREALEWIERETHPEDGATFERIHAKAAAALSAAPAETTPATERKEWSTAETPFPGPDHGLDGTDEARCERECGPEK